MVGLAAPAQALGQTGAGTTTAAVPRLDPAPGPLALGSAYAALAEDPMTLFYNPARLDPRSAGLGMAFQTLPVDAGASVAVFGDRLVVSLAAQNLGSEMGAGRAAPLPTTVRLGTALRFEPGAGRPNRARGRGGPTGRRGASRRGARVGVRRR